MPIRRGEGLIYCQDRFIAYARYELGDLYRDDERPVYRGGRGTLRVVGHPFPVRLELGTRYTLRLARNEEWCFYIEGIPARINEHSYSVVAGEPNHHED